MVETKSGVGGHSATDDFNEVWLVDFEFNGEENLPDPVCMVAREVKTGRIERLWREDLRKLRRPPFDVGPESLFVAYAAPAELSCFLALGWPIPERILDLFVEHRVQTNAFKASGGNSLLAAMTLRGLQHMAVADKERMRELILANNAWSPAEQREILDYCESDVTALLALLPAMLPTIDLPRALVRGRYMAAIASMVRNGVPVEHDLYRRMRDQWSGLKAELIEEMDRGFGLYDGLIFKKERFSEHLARHGIPWPRLASGSLDLRREVFGDLADRYPGLRPLHDLRSCLGKMNGAGLHINSDGRNRSWLAPFGSVTGRNQPSNATFIFGPGRWMRHLVKPDPGFGLAYVDWIAQEVGIAAGLSGDERLIEAYQSGDPYMAFAVAAGLAPPGATAEHDPILRNRCKAIVLGVGYGMGKDTLAVRAGISPVEAEDLLRRHKEVYRAYWRFSQASVDSAYLNGTIQSVYGWPARVGAGTKSTSLMNFPMQANGAEMMRVSAIAAIESGIKVCAPVHDAFLIEAPLGEIEGRVAEMQVLMKKAGERICGIPIRTDAKTIRAPDRFSEERGAEMWGKIMGKLDRVNHNVAG